MLSCLRHTRVVAGAALALLGGLHVASAQWAERFDTLIGTGNNVAPNKCWDTWDQAAGANSIASSAQSLSTPNSIQITGTSDTIQLFRGYTTGQWEFKTNVFVPSNSVGRSWCILMNKYVHGVHNNQDWSVQIAMNAATNAIFSQEANVTGTLIEDAWFELKVKIDLVANTAQIFVNNTLFASHPWVGPNGTNGQLQIQCLDLYAETTTSVAYHDNISLVRCDDCCVEIDPGTKFGNPFLYDTPLAQTFKPLKSGLACEIFTGLELASVPAYDFYVVNAPFGVVPTNYTTTYLYRALNQTAQNTNGAGPVNCLQDVMNSGLMLWSTNTYAIIIKKTGGANIMWRANAANTYPNGKAWVWDGGMWNLGTSGYGIADFTFHITGLINRTMRRCGFKDNCKLPFDPVWRSPALNGVYPSAPWKQFDDPNSDMWLGHTFRNLPNNIVRARLRFAAKPDSSNGGTFNDAITVGLCNNPNNPTPPPFWMFSRRLELLPEAMGHWDTNNKTVFTLDLHNLPDGGNIIGMMNATGMLDMWIVDDTMVDWAVLEIWTCPSKPMPFGLPTDTVGTATMGSWNPAERRLPVNNLGSSGQDGVALDLGEAQGFTVDLTNPSVPFSTAGSELSVVANGPSKATWDLAKNVKARIAGMGGGQIQLSADLSELGSTVQHLTYMGEDGAILANQTVSNLTPITFGGGGSTDFTISIYICKRKDGTWLVCISIPFPPRDFEAQGMVVPGVKYLAISVNDNTDTLEFARTGVVRGKHFTEVNLRRFRPAFFDIFADFATDDNTNSGDVTDEAKQASVTNIGSSGQDGVSMDMDLGRARSSFFDIFLEADLDGDGEIDEGSGITAQAYGSFNGHPNHPLGGVRYQRVHGFFDVFADFSDIGSTTKRIEVWNQGTLVISIPGFPSNDIGTSSRFPIRIGKLGQIGTKCIRSDFEIGTVFNIGPVVAVGDELRILAETVTGEIDYLQNFKFEGLNAQELNVWNASITPMTTAVHGLVQLQQCEPGGDLQTVTFEIRPVGSLDPVETHTVTLAPDGSYSFPTALHGSYDVTCQGSHWLRKLHSMVVLGGESVTQNFSLKNGDCDHDNEVNIVDFGIAATAFGSSPGDPNWDPRADLDCDDEVTLVDIGILAANFGEAGDE